MGSCEAPKPIAPSIMQYAADDRPAEQRRDGRERARGASTALSCAPSADDAGDQRSRRPTPSAISGPSGPSTAPKESVPIAASAMPGRVRQEGRLPAEPVERAVAAVARQETACERRRCMRPPRAARSPGTRAETTRRRWCGRSCQSQCSRSCTKARKRLASTAAGIPITAPRSTRRR